MACNISNLARHTCISPLTSQIFTNGTPYSIHISFSLCNKDIISKWVSIVDLAKSIANLSCLFQVQTFLKDTFRVQHTYFWPMQNDLVYLGILQTKFQTTAIIRWRVIAQWSAFHITYHNSYFPMSQPTAAIVNLCALHAWALGFA